MQARRGMFTSGSMGGATQGTPARPLGLVWEMWDNVARPKALSNGVEVWEVVSKARSPWLPGPGGALEAFIEAREEGKVRHLGFSAHSAECALALLDQFDFDSVLFPINWAHFLHGGFGPKVVEKAGEKEEDTSPDQSGTS